MIRCQFQSVCVGSGTYTSRGATVPYVMMLDGDRVVRIHHCPLTVSPGDLLDVPCEMRITKNGNYFFVYLDPEQDKNLLNEGVM